jgi:hypothetical protein
VDDEVLRPNALAPVPEVLFTKFFCDFLVSLEADASGFGKMIMCLVNGRAIRSKTTKRLNVESAGEITEISIRVVPQERCLAAVFSVGYLCVGCISWCVLVVLEFHTFGAVSMCSYCKGYNWGVLFCLINQ